MNFFDDQLPLDLISSTGRAMHQYHRDQGSNPIQALIFAGLISLLLTQHSNCGNHVNICSTTSLSWLITSLVVLSVLWLFVSLVFPLLFLFFGSVISGWVPLTTADQFCSASSDWSQAKKSAFSVFASIFNLLEITKHWRQGYSNWFSTFWSWLQSNTEYVINNNYY